jgi:predicted DNA binding protein
MKKSIKLNQVQDPVYLDRRLSDLHMEGDKITVEFLSEEGSDLVPLEDLTAEQLMALVLALEMVPLKDLTAEQLMALVLALAQTRE